MFSNKFAKISHWNRNPIRLMFSALRVEANRKDIKKKLCTAVHVIVSFWVSFSHLNFLYYLLASPKQDGIPKSK